MKKDWKQRTQIRRKDPCFDLEQLADLARQQYRDHRWHQRQSDNLPEKRIGLNESKVWLVAVTASVIILGLKDGDEGGGE